MTQLLLPGWIWVPLSRMTWREGDVVRVLEIPAHPVKLDDEETHTRVDLCDYSKDRIYRENLNEVV